MKRAGLRMSHSSGSVKNCTFKDHFSTQSGGSFSLITTYRFYGENLEIYNTTSLATVQSIYSKYYIRII